MQKDAVSLRNRLFWGNFTANLLLRGASDVADLLWQYGCSALPLIFPDVEPICFEDYLDGMKSLEAVCPRTCGCSEQHDNSSRCPRPWPSLQSCDKDEVKHCLYWNETLQLVCDLERIQGTWSVVSDLRFWLRWYSGLGPAGDQHINNIEVHAAVKSALIQVVGPGESYADAFVTDARAGWCCQAVFILGADFCRSKVIVHCKL